MYQLDVLPFEVSKLHPSESEETRRILSSYLEQGSTLTEIRTNEPAIVGSLLGLRGLRVIAEGLAEPVVIPSWVSVYPNTDDLAKLGKAGLARMMRMLSAIIDPKSEPDQIVTHSPAIVANALGLEGVRLKE